MKDVEKHLKNKLVEKFFDDLKEELLDEYNDPEEREILKCESPIEAVMFLALKDKFKHFNSFFNEFEVSINPQVQLISGNTTFRGDFEILVTDYERQENHFFLLECDGHDFHEKTKEQVANDRNRERLFMKKGYTVIRFAGSEIFESPTYCADEVVKIIKVKVKELKG